MDDKILSATELGPLCENICINASRIYDSCRAKECLENLRVYVSAENNEIISGANKITAEKAEVIWIYSDVEPLPFHKGYYTVNLKFYFRVELNAYTGLRRPVEIDGLAYYEKKIVLFGSTGEAKIFESKYKEDSFDFASWKKTNMPSAVAEVVDPIVLDTLVLGNSIPESDFELSSVPECVHRVFDGTLTPSENAKNIYVTLGLFLMVRLEREVQISVPAARNCIPDSVCHNEEIPGQNPCDMFRDLSFPFDEFFPPNKCEDDTSCSCNSD